MTPADGVTLRTARPDDYDSIARVVDDWWQKPVGRSLGRLFLDFFAATSRVAEDAAGLAGFLVAVFPPDLDNLAYAHFLGVRPDLRGSGLGRRLYQDLFERARAAGRYEIQAVTGEDNTGSIAFHRRLGFTVDGPLDDYDGPGRTMITFKIHLPPA